MSAGTLTLAARTLEAGVVVAAAAGPAGMAKMAVAAAMAPAVITRLVRLPRIELNTGVIQSAHAGF